MRVHRVTLLAALALPFLTGCATKGFVRRGLDDQRVALERERTERVQGDSVLRADMAREVAALRTDMRTMRDEFGAKIAMVEDKLTFSFPVHFAFDDATVRETDRAAIEKFASVAQRYYKGALITVEGFADPAGTPRYNLALSQRRADAVRDYLASKGMAFGQLKSVGMGESRQVRPGAERDMAGAELNRRVVFVVETSTDGAMTAMAVAGVNQ
jgi:outer membrane protein OmpA-like peptidoglycan-associated protein